ncbi:HlyD family type I secretion periplasmic adaptor subunit [Niveibacterium umoris]|uniref:Membrane fusion protein (MFP) family protein n=1 Tax=Niveibacterium umoris TaxID=1193620 RepID=A0A840BKH0_9RHOO|nr:HlyD family type I secretion periplasmic adaptor subunit [Niveibacterium umoris]MBB4012078.1 hemolysin D [Niveibacterium umoris]
MIWKLKLLAWCDILNRYRSVLQTSWTLREELSPPQRSRDEREFLPASLELMETPPSPLPRRMMWTLIALIGFTLAWAFFGRVDIVAVASGKIVPSGYSKTIQSPELAVVRRIHVENGQFVKAGETLVELDATGAESDRDRAMQAWVAARLAAARAATLVEALRRGAAQNVTKGLEGAPLPARWQPEVQREQAVADGLWRELQARLASADAERSQKEAERDTAKELVVKLSQTLPLVAQRASDYKKLVEENFMSYHGYLDREQLRIEMERDLAAQKNKVRELDAGLVLLGRQRESIVAEFRKTQLSDRAAALERAAELEQEHIKNDRRSGLLRVVAPVDGVVQQLAVHTVGGVLKEAEPMMIVVPRQDHLLVEATLENKDIGFVERNQPATVKVETFPYTKYGTLKGVVRHVSTDAIPDQKRGLTYQALVELDQSRMRVGNKDIALTPGMAVSVEIKTGVRTVMEYFLDPLIVHTSESLRER